MSKMTDFFNELAESWDLRSIPPAEKIKYILEKTELEENSEILDIACGTGVLESFLLEKNPKSILAVDIAENMLKKANEKYSDERITFELKDALTIKNKSFDYIIVYNAFPHFLEPQKLIDKVHTLLKENGKFVICHGMGRKDLNDHHKRKANEISLGLRPASENTEMLKEKFDIKHIQDTKEIYIIYAVKK